MGKEQELLEAARLGNAALIEKILNQKNKWSLPLPLPQNFTNNLRKGVHPDCQDSNGETPLHHAALNGHRDVVELLLKLRASANIPDQRGCYPLHLAAWRGNADICKILLCHGPSVAQVNAQNQEGDTALHSAAQYGHTSVVSFLLQNGADPNVTNKKAESALDLAAHYGRVDSVRLLLRAVQHQQQAGFLSVASERSPLHLAARNGHLPVVTDLLDAGFDINRKTEEGSALHEAALFGRLDVVRHLLERGIDLSIKDTNGKTALDIVCEQKNQTSIEIQKLITEQGLSEAEPTYDQLPVPRSVGIPSDSSSRGSVHSAASRDSVFDFPVHGSNDAEAVEESIYDRPTAHLRAVIPAYSQSGSCQSLNDDTVPPGTPKKPPRKKNQPNTTMVKGESLEKIEKKEMVGVGGVALSSIPSDVAMHCTTSNTADQAVENLSLTDTSASRHNNNDVVLATVSTTTVASVDNANSRDQGVDSGGDMVGNSQHGPVSRNTNDNDVANNNSENSAIATVPTESKSGLQKSDAHTSLKRATMIDPSARPPVLDFASKRVTYAAGASAAVPLSPTNYEQPPTPEHPPPSPMTAILGIQAKINPQDRRRSRDMETITEQEFLGGGEPAAAAADLPASVELRHAAHSNGAEEAVRTNDKVIPIPTVDNPFVGLLKGSTAPGSGLRKVKSQRCESKGPVMGINKRRSVPCPPRTNFSAVIDSCSEPTSGAGMVSAGSQPELDVSRTRGSRSVDNRSTRLEKSQSSFGDETEEWAKIEDIISSIGSGWHMEVIKEFDQRMCNVQSSAADSSVQSVGDWLAVIGLPQYENDLIANGYDDMRFMGRDVLEESNLVEVGITDPQHIQMLLKASAKLPTVQPTTCSTLKDWLESLHLIEYMETFVKHGFHDVARIRQVWEVELTTILDIARLGHRKRILASIKPFSSSVDSDVEIQDGRQSAGQYRKESMTATTDTACTERSPVQSWCHRPESLIKGCCNYAAQYLGSTLVGELEGTDSTKTSISQLKKSSGNISKVPRIILSISYRGVKFIDGTSKKVICEHEIDNIFCACQDGDDLTVFAYITRDLGASDKEKHYCHVFRVDNTDQATEVILTLGEAFEVAYQIAMQDSGSHDGEAAPGSAGGSCAQNVIAPVRGPPPSDPTSYGAATGFGATTGFGASGIASSAPSGIAGLNSALSQKILGGSYSTAI